MNMVNGSVSRGSYVEKRSTETASAGDVKHTPAMANNAGKLEISGENKQNAVKNFLKEMISLISNGLKSEGAEKTEKPTKTESRAPVPHESTVTSGSNVDPGRTMASDAVRTRNHDVDVFKDACKELKTKFPEKAYIIDAAIAKMDEKVANLPKEFDTSKSPSKATKEFMGFPEKKNFLGWKSVDKKDIAGTKTEFKALCKELGIKGDAKGLLGAAARAKVDGGPVVTKSATFIGKSGDPETAVTSTITPANGNAAGDVRSARMAELGDRIVSSQSNKSTESRAGNLQMTSLTADGKTVFSASRHAILSTKGADPGTVKMPPSSSGEPMTVSSFSLSLVGKSAAYIESELKPFVGNSDDLASMTKAFASRNESKIESQTTKLAGKISNRNKASDLVNASLTQKINRELSECKTPEEKSAKIADWQKNGIQLDLTSVSLVTPHGLKGMPGYEEAGMLMDQAEALDSIQNLSTAEANEMLSGLTVDGEPGKPRKPLFEGKLPTVTVDTASINFGVNPGERLGRSTQAKQNEAAMEKLFSKADAALEKLEKLDSNSPEAKTLRALNDKTKEAFKQYQSEGALSTNGRLNAYEMPVLTLALSSLSGCVTAFNCMSGKDRTGMADVLVKRMMTEITAAGGDEAAIGKAVNMFSNAEATFAKLESGKTETVSDDELSSFRRFQKDNREMMLSSGNKEVQIDNTGTFGFKLKGGNNEKNFEMLFDISRKETSGVTGFSGTKGA